jgi:hypothetical protein
MLKNRSDTMNTLRSELIESQKTRSDLMKWKLLIVAGIGGAALGFSGEGPGNAHFALAVLPLACAYVDLLCRNLSLRTKAIGLFIEHGAHDSAPLRAYEKFYRDIHDSVWGRMSLESWALRWSTVLISIAIVPVGILAGSSRWHPLSWPSGLFYASSVLGLVVALWIERTYRKHIEGAICRADKRAASTASTEPSPVVAPRVVGVQQAVAADAPQAARR